MESREVCLNVKGSNYRFWRSADGRNLGARDRLRSLTAHQIWYLYLGDFSDRARFCWILRLGFGWYLAMQASLLSFELRVQRRHGLGISPPLRTGLPQASRVLFH
jgi:hypothetical protein